MIYLIGSLRNPNVPLTAQRLQEAGYEVFSDWYAAGSHADECWQAYELSQGRTYAEALKRDYAQHIFNYDLAHLNQATMGVLVMPAGRSGFLELGYLIGQGKPGYIILDTTDRWDVMFKFATDIYSSITEFIYMMKEKS